MSQKTSDLYKELYHYTNWQGLIGILQSQCLWATHYKFLNDYTEIDLFKDKLVEFLLPEIKTILPEYYQEQQIGQNGGLEIFSKNETERAVNCLYKTLYDTLNNEMYIMSFCGHNDEYANQHGLLSQWRGYGGYAFVFDTKKLEEIFDEKEAKLYDVKPHFSNVCYSNDWRDYQQAMSDEIQSIAEYINKTYSVLAQGQESICPEKSNKAIYSYIECITRYKHEGFKEENEVRIVALLMAHSEESSVTAEEVHETLIPEKPRKFRGENNTPYIELFKTHEQPLSLENITAEDITLPIKRIIVGPHKDKEQRVASLKTILRNTGIEVTASDIPYIGN